MTATRTTWGGSRPGAGRPAKHAIASEPHQRRPALSRRHPVHVVARVVPEVRRLRVRAGRRAIAHAVALSLARTEFRIVHVSVLAHRLELIVEADDRLALARGMQGFQIAAARALNRAYGRRGAVFADRYRPCALTTRAAVRAAIVELPPATVAAAWPHSWLLVVELVPARSWRLRPARPP